MTKEEIITQLREKGIEFNPSAHINSLRALLEKKEEVKEEKPKDNQVNEVLSKMMQTLSNLDNRLAKLEKGESLSYRVDAKNEDIERATETKRKVEDPKIISIVEESLGTDFGIEIEPFGDRPGFLFTVIVPQRLSDNVMDARPLKGEDGKYVTDAIGNRQYEQYFPEDRRSKAIGSLQSYDAIREHCDKVRSYIVAYYAKTKQPLPEFKVK